MLLICIIYLYNIFNHCISLKYINLENLDTSSVENMAQVFYDCSSLISLDLSHFDTSNANTMMGMFKGCSQLSFLDLSNFRTSNVLDMTAMFLGCSNLLSLNLNNFDTSKLTDMHKMFKDCSSLISLDLSSFAISNSPIMTQMFAGSNLNSIYCINDNSIISILQEVNSNFNNDCYNLCFSKTETIKISLSKKCLLDCTNDEPYIYIYVMNLAQMVHILLIIIFA